MKTLIREIRSFLMVVALLGCAAGLWIVPTWRTWLVGTVLVLLVVLIWKLPQWYASRHLTDSEVGLRIENDARKSILEVIGGGALLVGLAFTWQNLQHTQEATNLTLDRAREGQVTDRFVRSVEQLGSKELSVRVGAVYSLDRIASESSRDVRPIVEILAAFVRSRGPYPGEKASSLIRQRYRRPKPDDFKFGTLAIEDNGANSRLTRVFLAADLQASLGIIASRWKPSDEQERLDLTACFLRAAAAPRCHILNIDFSFSDLRNVYFAETTFERTMFAGTLLMDGEFSHTVVSKVVFIGSDLRGATFYKATLNCAFISCDLRYADFTDADLTGVTFSQVDARSTDFTGVKGLAEKQIKDGLRTDSNTILPTASSNAGKR